MKKIVLVATMLFAGIAVQAQEGISKNAIGLRLGGNDGFGVEVSYQRKLQENNRLELDLGWRSSNHYDAVKLTGIYQWIWNIEGGFNWYAGVGGGLGSWSYDAYWHKGHYYNESDFFLFVGGQIGIEYNFDFPLQLSADFRPEIYLINNDFHNTFGPDFAISARYKF